MEDRYTTRWIYPVCLNLELRHYEFLTQITKTQFGGSYDFAIYSLLNKYLNHLYEIRITPYKKTETANYQPRTKQYKRKTLNINPIMWSKLFEMRHFVGYSISALIRIMLEWEMQSLGYDIIPWIAFPNINYNSNYNIEIMQYEHSINNYYYEKQGFYQTREIIANFLDQFT
jgi:hypothetical protein